MDDILKNTLATATNQPALPPTPKGLLAPDLTGNNKADIKTLEGAQQKPSTLMNFQGVMQKTAQQAYNERQSSELGGLNFDPSKVSGGTFSSIIGNLEAKRGADISKIYASTLNTYVAVQDRITDQLQFLQEMEEKKRQFEEEMKLEKKKLAELKKTNKREYEIQKDKMKEDTRQFNLQFNESKRKANTNIDDYEENLISKLREEFYNK